MPSRLTNIKIETNIFKKVTRILSEAKELKQSDPAAQKKKTLSIKFTDYIPTIPAGKYSFNVQQKVRLGKGNGTQVDVFNNNTVAIVQTPETLDETKIYHKYPPKAAFGNYIDVLPHVILNSSNLPWQQTHYAGKPNDGVGWLALVILSDDEVDLFTKPGQKIKIPAHLIPPKDALCYLTHVVQIGENMERSVLMAHRLPKPQKNNIAHIIALNETPTEDMYTSLYSWNFTCEAADNTFQSLLSGLDCDLFRLPPASVPEDRNDKELLKLSQAYNHCLENGFVPLPHFARNGQRIMSWYRSPLTPYDVDVTFHLRYINHSDYLLRYFKKSQRLDTTYASAWELGRWLTLEQKEIAETLYTWKRKIALQEKVAVRQKRLEKRKNSQEMVATEKKLTTIFASASLGNEHTIPEPVKQWLLDLVRLAPVPFCNLVPDEKLLPAESIRLFHVDEGWIWALIDGALSIGRMPSNETNSPITIPELYLTGFLLRSDAVQAFPEFEITANGKLLPVEKRIIGKDILFCLFHSKEPIKTVEAFLLSGDTHFGLDLKLKSNTDGTKSKVLIKKFFTRPNESLKNQIVEVPFSDLEERIIDIPSFAKKMEVKPKQKSSTFALRLLEASPKVVVAERP
jgi:hypothetical protein